MGAKALATEKRILDAAEKLFSQKGFSAVTMKDISLAVPISRGGLYRYFPSTFCIFAEIIRREQKSALLSLKRAKDGEVSPDKILSVYLSHRMNSIASGNSGIDNAIGEFAASSDEAREIAVKRAEDCINIISELITMGNKTGVFNCKDPVSIAKHISWVIEGMCKHSALCSISAEDAEAEISFIENILK